MAWRWILRWLHRFPECCNAKNQWRLFLWLRPMLRHFFLTPCVRDEMPAHRLDFRVGWGRVKGRHNFNVYPCKTHPIEWRLLTKILI